MILEGSFLMNFDISTMKKIISGLYSVAIYDEFGDDGTKALKFLLENIHKLYKHFDPSSITKSLYLIAPIHTESNIQDRVSTSPQSF